MCQKIAWQFLEFRDRPGTSYRLHNNFFKFRMANNKKVCIIGGGPAGIMAVSILKYHCDVECFEQANDIGGQWGKNTDEYCKEKYGDRWSR